MLFNTYTFAVFLVIVFLLYRPLPLRGRQILLLAASYIFYCWETPVYGLLLLASTILDFFCGLAMPRMKTPAGRKTVLAVSLLGNLGMLGFFKYGDFFASNAFGLARLLGFDVHWSPMNFILPVGISFYTFQTMSYTIQLYRRQIEPTRDFLTFALFVSFFPQLVAGPIERAAHLLPQLKVYQRVAFDDLAVGCQRILFGLFRKLVVADRFSMIVDRVYAHPLDYPTFTVWIGVLSFWGQIYFDFAGYADIAIGSARLFGIHLTENFRRPIMATSVADFWSRWHITLTSWLRDYVFMPLGGFRKGMKRAALNGFIVLTLCGLWHGAAWHFVFWGMYGGLLMIGYYTWRSFRRRISGRKTKPRPTTLVLIASIALTLFVNIGFGLLFRTPDMPTAWKILQAMAGRHAPHVGPNEWDAWLFLAMLIIWLGTEYMQEYHNLNDRIRRWPWWIRAVGLALVALMITLFGANMTSPYIYFQF